MNKRILYSILAIIMVAFLTSCSFDETQDEKVNRENSNIQSSMFVCIEVSTEWKVVYHKETKVMYVVSDYSYNTGTFTLLVNADGSPMLYESYD